MKVLVIQRPGKLEIVEMEKPVPGPKECLMKVHHCGICGTDMSILHGTLVLGEGRSMRANFPVRPGHEWSGVVEETGSETWRIKPGTRVISDTGWSCGECEACLEGNYQNCEKGRAIGTTGNCWPGAFADYMLMPERLLYEVPDNVSLTEAALVEPASIGYYGLSRTPIGPNKTLLVLGTGAIGLGGMACAKAVGVGKTLLAGRKDAKLKIGKQMGADVLVNTEKEDLLDVVMRETKGKGADIVLDTTGNPSLLNTAIRCTRGSGHLVIPGFYEQVLDNVELDNLIARNITLVGAAGTPNLGRKLLDLLAYGHMSLLPMITDHFPFDQIVEAFAASDERKATRIKVMIDMVEGD